MKQESKIGILKYIAGKGAKGVKFEDELDTWYNPANDEAKTMVKEDYKGKQVEIMLADGEKTKFTSMVLLAEGDKTVEEKEPVVEEETIEEEKVPQTPPKEEEAEEPDPELLEEDEMKSQEEFNPLMGLKGLMKKMQSDLDQMQYSQATYAEMESTKLGTATKGPQNLTYASWAEAWGALKRIHPTAQFYVHEDKNGMPVFFNKDFPMMGAFVKVTVKVQGLEHTVHLPVMNHSNKSMKLAEITTFDINKNIQRALAKAIAMHGMGLYVFKGEDYPEEPTDKK